MSNTMMTGRRNQVRRITMQTWLVLRWNPETRQVDEYELTCQSGTFLTEYRTLGLIDTDLSGALTLFDPYEDDWDRELLNSWTETSEVRIR